MTFKENSFVVAQGLVAFRCYIGVFCIFMTNKPWTEDEFVLALELYFRIPFGSISKTNPDIIKLANLLGRTPSSVGMRLSNYAHLDPNLRANGLSGGGKNCAVYWEKYANNLPQLKIDAALSRIKIVENVELSQSIQRIKDVDRLVEDMYDFKFQDIVLSNYSQKCAITGMGIPSLVTACHIIPTSIDDENNLKADNGLCLTILHAKAFVDGLISIDSEYRLHISPSLKKYAFENGYSTNFKRYDNQLLSFNNVISKPNPEYLEWHMNTVFQRV